MIRRIILICILSIGLWKTLSLRAQDWTLWLYHRADGLLLQLDTNGKTLDIQSIPYNPDYAYPDTPYFSPDGTLIAYVNHHESSFQQSLNLYHLTQEKIILSYDLIAPDGFEVNADDKLLINQRGFRADSQRFAFVSFIAGEGWTIHVVDTTTGKLTHELVYADAQVKQQPYLHSASIPLIQAFEDDIVWFTIQNEDGNPSAQAHNYAWFLVSNQVREDIAFPTIHNDHFTQTGETLYPLPNIHFPSENEDVPVIRQQNNVLHVYLTSNQSRYPSIARPELDLLNVWFIQAGEAILIEAREDAIRSRWLIYDRNGEQIRNLPAAGTHITATPDGFLYLTELNEKTILVNVNTRKFETAGDTLWIDEGEWQIVYADRGINSILLPFPQLAESITPPPYITLEHLEPTPFPRPEGLVRIGREMQLQVKDNGYINLRDEPSTNGGILALLETGVYVTVIDGPLISSTFTWWQVQIGNRTGWLIEEFEGTQILIPRLPVDESELEDEEN